MSDHVNNTFHLLLNHKILYRKIESDDFELPTNHKFYSKDEKYYIVFQQNSKLALMTKIDDSVLWETDNDSIPNSLNKCFLQKSGNLVIYDQNMISIWYSVQEPFGQCEGHCTGDPDCASGLLCYAQDFPNSARFLGTDVTGQPTLSDKPSDLPSLIPSDKPSDLPSLVPSEEPSVSSIPSEEVRKQVSFFFLHLF